MSAKFCSYCSGEALARFAKGHREVSNLRNAQPGGTTFPARMNAFMRTILTRRTGCASFRYCPKMRTCISRGDSMGFDTMIRNGTVVTATDTYASDIGITGGQIAAIAQAAPHRKRRQNDRRHGLLVMPGGIDVHTHLDMPFGGTTSADDFETGTRRRGLRRHDHADRFRHSVQGPDPAPGVRHVDEKGRRQGRDRLRVPLHHHRSRRRATRRDGRAGPRRRLDLQTFHGLSGRVHAGRRDDFPRHAAGRQARRHDLHARGKRRRDRRARAARAGRRQDARRNITR